MKKEVYKKIEKLERRRKKIEKLYKSKYESLFNDLCPLGQKAKSFNIEETADFVLIELDISKATNKLYIKTIVKSGKTAFCSCIINIKTTFNKLYAKIQFFISKFIAFQLMRVYNKLNRQ